MDVEWNNNGNAGVDNNNSNDDNKSHGQIGPTKKWDRYERVGKKRVEGA